MSYILQALQRAQAERRPNEGSGPDLGPTPWMTDPAATGAAVHKRRRVLQVGGGLLGLTLAVAAGWWFGRQAAPAPSSLPAGLPAAASPMASVPTPVADAPPPGTQGPERDSVPTSAPEQSTPAAATTAHTVAPTRTPPPALLPREAAVPERATVAPPVASAPSLPVSREALPAAVRAGLPPLRIGGAIGADRPADRMLLVDGRVVREGETVVPGLVLQSIGSRQAIFAWREQRFSVAY